MNANERQALERHTRKAAETAHHIHALAWATAEVLVHDSQSIDPLQRESHVIDLVTLLTERAGELASHLGSPLPGLEETESSSGDIN